MADWDDVRRIALSLPEAVERLATHTVERFGRVDVLCNNAGVSTFNMLRDQTLDGWRWVLSVNLWGVVHGLHSFLPIMRRQGEKLVAGGEQLAVQTVGPSVVRALDSAAKAALRRAADPRPAMAAHVEKRAQGAAGVTGHDDAFTGDVDEHEVARSRNLLEPSHTRPAAREQEFALRGEDVG